MGEVHVVFVMLKVIGKYIESSGLHSLFLESGTYRETMLKQILQGKHMKRVVEVNISMHLALALICFKEWLTSNRKYKDVINEVTSTTKETKQLEYTKQHTYRAFLG